MLTQKIQKLAVEIVLSIQRRKNHQENNAMANPVYAVCYEKSGDFLIAIKNQKCYFMIGKKNTKLVKPNGDKIKHGPGKFALPGGNIEKGEKPKNAAERELLEETGFDITQVNGVKSINKKFPDGKNPKYNATFFEIESEIFKQITTKIIKVNLPNGEQAAGLIRKGKITNYDKIHNNQECKDAPQDNEFASAQVWNITKDWNKIEELKKDHETDWFYHILSHLREDILKKQ